jgi:hypothetical protein
MTIAPALAESLACRVLKDGLLYLAFLFALAGCMAAGLFAVPRIIRFFDDRTSGRRRQTTSSKGAKR